MREIKFRAWSKDGRKTLGGKMMTHEDMCDDFGNIDIYQRDGYSVMQYTGLKDKNGKEIYEGDIVDVSSFNPSRYEVVFDRGGFCMRHDKDDFYYPDGKYLEDGAVIGNIYENPELLTK